MHVPRRWVQTGGIVLVVLIALWFIIGLVLREMGVFLILDEPPRHADAAVVLLTGVDYFPRLTQAAALYRAGLVDRIVIDGNRKSDAMRALEQQGFRLCCPWYADPVRILEIQGVPRERVVAVSAEDAYDTISEAGAVGPVLRDLGIGSVLITTSKYHTRRAHFIWERMYRGVLSVHSVAAQDDPYSPQGWWKEGRQIRWVLAEYGAWFFYALKGGGGAPMPKGVLEQTGP